MDTKEVADAPAKGALIDNALVHLGKGDLCDSSEFRCRIIVWKPHNFAEVIRDEEAQLVHLGLARNNPVGQVEQIGSNTDDDTSG